MRLERFKNFVVVCELGTVWIRKNTDWHSSILALSVPNVGDYQSYLHLIGSTSKKLCHGNTKPFVEISQSWISSSTQFELTGDILRDNRQIQISRIILKRGTSEELRFRLEHLIMVLKSNRVIEVPCLWRVFPTFKLY